MQLTGGPEPSSSSPGTQNRVGYRQVLQKDRGRETFGQDRAHRIGPTGAGPQDRARRTSFRSIFQLERAK